MFFDTHYLPIVTTMMFFAGLTAVGFGYFVSRVMTVRLFALANAADNLAQGDLTTRLDVRGNDEIAHLIRSFNAMAHDLQEVDEQKRQLEKTRRDLVAWVSHDLRTPLTSMRVMLEALADGVITDTATQSRYIHSTLSEIEHLSRLIQDLFEMAQLDVGHLNLDYAQTPIADLISDTIGGLMPKAQHKNITLTGHVEADIDLIQVAPDKIQRVLKNLIDNAIKYSPNGEAVRVTACRKDKLYIQIDIHNTGVYIAEEVLPNLFESFYRGEQSRANTESERGTGLGLAIARGFVHAHGGEIWVESVPNKGTTFSFTIPEHPSPLD
jgi:signal transduction histidine kinase